MIVTLDSNITDVSQKCAQYLGAPNGIWCTKLNRCNLNTDTESPKIYYNSPISMADSVSDFSESNMVHFIYVDHRNINDTLSRIIKNTQSLKNAVIFSNADIYMMGKYHLKVGNCTNSMIAEFMGHVVQSYINDGALIHPNAVKQKLSGFKIDEDMTPTDTMTCDLYSIFEYKQLRNQEMKDCRVCSI